MQLDTRCRRSQTTMSLEANKSRSKKIENVSEDNPDKTVARTPIRSARKSEWRRKSRGAEYAMVVCVCASECGGWKLLFPFWVFLTLSFLLFFSHNRNKTMANGAGPSELDTPVTGQGEQDTGEFRVALRNDSWGLFLLGDG